MKAKERFDGLAAQVPDCTISPMVMRSKHGKGVRCIENEKKCEREESRWGHNEALRILDVCSKRRAGRASTRFCN